MRLVDWRSGCFLLSDVDLARGAVEDEMVVRDRIVKDKDKDEKVAIESQSITRSSVKVMCTRGSDVAVCGAVSFQPLDRFKLCL